MINFNLKQFQQEYKKIKKHPKMLYRESRKFFQTNYCHSVSPSIKRVKQRLK